MTRHPLIAASPGHWAVATLAFALALGTPPVAASADCEPREAYEQAVRPRPPSVPGEITVPVVIHIMERPGPGCSVRGLWPSDRLGALFTASDRDGVAFAWDAAKIRFVVEQVELHTRTFPPVLFEKIPSGGIHTADPAWQAALEHLLKDFHRAGRVNVYFWDTATLTGHGRGPSIGYRGTVWLGWGCATSILKSCARTAAHELGHALGLYHVGGGDACANSDPEFHDVCGQVTKTCAGPVPAAGAIPDKDRLMRQGDSGTGLCPREIEVANVTAQQLR